jgi:uncharacterized membrane protein YgaE (UPF0421/DUF939 family)
MDRKEIKFLFNYLENNRKHLNSLQHNFITSSKDYYNATSVLTKRQVECLNEMKDYINSQALEETDLKTGSDIYQAQYSSYDHLSPFRM